MKNSVSTVATPSPDNDRADGNRLSAPAPLASTNGTAPSTVAITVMRIGRSRSTSFDDRRADGPALIARLVGELDDEDAVLGHEPDQQHDADLAVEIGLKPVKYRA